MNLASDFSHGATSLPACAPTCTSHWSLSFTVPSASSSRVARSASKPSARLWLTGGAVSMGCGIWSMHFVGMLAFSLPVVALSYDIVTTLGSLVIAIGPGYCVQPALSRLNSV